MNTFTQIYIYFITFLLGTCVGSFINVMVYRIPIGMSFVRGRSMCPKCKERIKLYDLIPVLSYLILRGRCRSCTSNISLRYPFVELTAGLLSLTVLLTLGFTTQALLAFFLSMILLTVSNIDIDTMTIPDGLVVALIPLAAASALLSGMTIKSKIIGFFCVSLPMLVITYLVPDAFGGGDIKLIAVCGFILGWQNTLVATFIALLLGGSHASYLLLSKKCKVGTHMAFGPYLCIGIFTAYLWGDKLVAWYLGLLF